MNVLQIACPKKSGKTTKEIPARSCLDYFKRGQRTCGFYKINDLSGNTFTVYCDMNSEAGAAWTLVMSYALKNRIMKQFRKSTLQENAPVNENSPNWNVYRMSLTQMTHLKSQSTHWRATCSFPILGVDYTDYVRGKFADFDIMTFLGNGVCKKVEYVNIRGHRCAHCTSKWWQLRNINAPHIDSSATGCEFVPWSGVILVKGEDNFGFYGVVNSKFRCSSDSSATTNWWFGGYQ